ncbi:hypothetical protein F4809DRAFT_318589 [Biscogniauxia mediterranea]|nr:hypothetical protein F4809DRAFT_318589 [Biscogniauxia mediterranea]
MKKGGGSVLVWIGSIILIYASRFQERGGILFFFERGASGYLGRCYIPLACCVSPSSATPFLIIYKFCVLPHKAEHHVMDNGYCHMMFEFGKLYFCVVMVHALDLESLCPIYPLCLPCSFLKLDVDHSNVHVKYNVSRYRCTFVLSSTSPLGNRSRPT